MSRNRYDCKTIRREDAEDRQRHYNNLSLQARLDVARSRRGESAREVARLEKLIEAGLA